MKTNTVYGDYPAVSSSEYFCGSTAKIEFLVHGEPVLRDHKGNFGYLRKRNFHRFNFKSMEEFVAWFTENLGEWTKPY